MQSAVEIRRTARQAGLLYLAMSILAMFSFFYLHGQFVVPGDAAATARNILARETLYRVGVLIDVVTQILFVLLTVALYRLFRDVDRNQAYMMVALVGTGIAAGFASFAMKIAPLMLLSGKDYLSVFTPQQLEALSYASISLMGRQGQLLTFIWGLWLFPFAALTIRSGFLPRFLGVLLILSGVAYVASCVAEVAFPAHAPSVKSLAMPLYFGEFIVVLWLALVGARPRTAAAVE